MATKLKIFYAKTNEFSQFGTEQGLLSYQSSQPSCSIQFRRQKNKTVQYLIDNIPGGMMYPPKKGFLSPGPCYLSSPKKGLQEHR
jgi:hypothetical protein